MERGGGGRIIKAESPFWNTAISSPLLAKKAVSHMQEVCLSIAALLMSLSELLYIMGCGEEEEGEDSGVGWWVQSAGIGQGERAR